MASSSKTKKRVHEEDNTAIKFGEFTLHKFTEGSNKAFRPLVQHPLKDATQKCLLDNLWAAATAKHKLLSLNCLNIYMSKMSNDYNLNNKQPVESAKIQPESAKVQPYYVIFKGHKIGVFNNYSTVIKMTTGFDGALVKVYDSLASALQAALLEIGSNFEIETESKRKIVKTDNPYFLSDRNEEMEVLKQKIANLKAILSDEQEKNIYQQETIQNQQRAITTLDESVGAQQRIIKTLEESVAAQQRIIATLEGSLAQHRYEAEEKQKILHEYECQIQEGPVQQNRTFQQLTVRLKRPGYAIPTLKPLFSACPDLEQIIRKKASTAFYNMLTEAQKEIIDLYFHRVRDSFLFHTCEVRQIITTEWETPILDEDEAAAGPDDQKRPKRIVKHLTGIFSLSIDLDNTNIPESRIRRYYELGMIHHMKVSNPSKITWFGDKLGMVANLLIKQEEATNGIIHIHCVNRLPRNYEGFNEEPAQHRITITNRYLSEEVEQRTKPCQCFITFDEPLIYETLGEKYLSGPYGSNSGDFHEKYQLYTEGHYTQIYGPKYQTVGWFFPLHSDEYAAQEVIEDILGSNNIEEEDASCDLSIDSHSPRSI